MSRNVTVTYGSRSAVLVKGWVPQPDGRGSIDILWSCGFTIFLSSWSTLCLNLPAEKDSWWIMARRKFLWVLLTIMGPEIIFQLALGEWLRARRSVKAFKDLGHDDWTMTHSFYSNMGGFMLKTPDQGRFPINAAQLHYLLVKGHVQYPTIDKKKILDKNKAEAIVRCLTLGQIVWFLVNCIARLQQGLALTTIELSTLAFTFSAAGSFYCWYHKPMDIETPDEVEITATIELIQQQALGKVDDTWLWTPLDFIDRHREWPWNIYWQCGTKFALKTAEIVRMSWFVPHTRSRPIERFPDDYWPAPTFRSLPALFVFHIGYAAILVAGWNLSLPTYTELVLWRISTLIQLGTIMSAWLTMPLMMEDAPSSLKRLFSSINEGRQNSTCEVRRKESLTLQKWYSRSSITERTQSYLEKTRSYVSDDANWAVSVRLLIVYQLTWAVYFTTRMYIIVEDMVSMRALPATGYATVKWSEYLPHV